MNLPKIRNEKGSTLIVAVMLLIILGVVVGSFAFWLAVQSRGLAHKKAISRAEYYGETVVQRALRYIQDNPSVQQALLTNNATNYHFLVGVDTGTVADVKIKVLQ